LSERLEEEWLADLEARTTPAARLLLGLGCCWAAAVIVQESLAPGLTAASTTGNKIMSSYARADVSILPQRTTALAVIIGLHVLLILAFASGLGPRAVAILPQAIQTSFLEKPKEPLPPPPRTTVKLTKPTVVIPEYPIKLDLPTDAETIHAPAPVETHVSPQPPEPPPAPVKRVLGNAGKGFPNSADYYPASALRLGETGTAIIQVCVNSKGYLTGAPSVAKSAGSPRLDEGALKLARAGSGHYRATTENGQPVDSCFPLDITFNIRD
jgi:protein TonB